MIDRKFFFDAVRAQIFDGHLDQPQVGGMNVLLDRWELFHDRCDVRWFAYILATAAWETGRTMQPVRERDEGRGRPYGRPDPVTKQVYYGRGLVQLTWKANYLRQSRKLGIPLGTRPDLALVPNWAATILIRGMIDGDFTGAQLDQFFNGDVDDPLGARTIVNGTDHADEIANMHYAFLNALSPEPAEDAPPDQNPPPTPAPADADPLAA